MLGAKPTAETKVAAKPPQLEIIAPAQLSIARGVKMSPGIVIEKIGDDGLHVMIGGEKRAVINVVT